jgi:hypothetical protein
VQVFGYGQFSTAPFNQAAKRSLGDTQATLFNLRTLSHPIDSDWLLGAEYSSAPSSNIQGTGASILDLWQSPSGGGTAKRITITSGTDGSSTEVRGMAVAGGSN